MPNSDFIPSLLFKIKENQLELEAAIMELRTGSSGAAEVADNVSWRLEHDPSE